MTKRQNENQPERNQSRPNPSQSVPSRRETSHLPLSGGNPFALLRRFANEMDDLFGNFGFGRSPLLNRTGFFSPSLESGWPQIDIFENNGQIVIRADVPGLKKEDLHVEVNDDELTISGERKDEREEHKGEFYRSERSYGRFERRIALPDGTNSDDIACTFQNGILEIRMKTPEQQTKRGRRIEIQDKGSPDKPERAA